LLNVTGSWNICDIPVEC